MNNIIKSISLNNEFYKNDVLNMKNYPNEDIANKFNKTKKSIIDLNGIKSIELKNEIKIFLDNIINTNTTNFLNIKTTYLTPLNNLIKFFVEDENGDIKSIIYCDSSIRDYYKEYLEKKGISIHHKSKKWIGDSVNVKIIDKMKNYIEEINDNRIGFERDLWYIDKLAISKDRINKSKSIKRISFKDIECKENRELVKIYMKYLIGNTDKSISTVTSELGYIKEFISYIKYKEVNSLQRKDIEIFYEYINSKNLNDKTFNKYIYVNFAFMQYLEVRGVIEKNHFYFQDIKTINTKFKLSSINSYVTNQIFNILDDIDFKLSTMFLIIYCTGMRVSDVCQLKNDCLYSDENGFFIKYYCQKMRKEVTNPIPENLFNIISKKVKDNKLDYDYGEKYLFPSDKNKPYLSSTYRRQMKAILKEHGVKNPDGSEYEYKCHDYRHTLATDMLNKDIPLNIIQKILHHESQEMTLAYAEINDDRRIKKHKEFINIKGKFAPISSEIKVDDIAKIEWIRENINAQILPNGICALPVKLNKCPHANSCLTCDKFRTNKKYLQIHKNHLKRVDEYLEIARKNNWIRQIETNEEIRVNLINIINKLEKICKGDECNECK